MSKEVVKEIVKSSWYMTSGIAEEMKQNEAFEKEIKCATDKYMHGDWGDTCESDKKLNDEALDCDDRIVAKYVTTKGDIFIITEWDRSNTTIMFADEY